MHTWRNHTCSNNRRNNDEHRIKLVKICEILGEAYLIINSDIYHAWAGKMFNDNKLAFGDRIIFINEIGHNGKQAEIYTPRPSDIAFIQFSSGSTGEPKGVIVTHGNLVSNTRAAASCSKMSIEDISLNWMPVTHDMGLIGAHLTSNLVGMDQFIMPTKLFIKRPTLWLSKASEHKATRLYSPNFGYKHFLTFYDAKNAEGWDLSNVRTIFNGAEPISEDLCNMFLDKMKCHGLKRESMLTVYGLAEATVAVSFPPVGEEFITHRVDRRSLGIGQKIRYVDQNDVNSVTFVDVGYPIDECFVRICDENNVELPENHVGNIQISGMNVTRGYFNNSDATSKVFTDDGWLITGDLGFLKDRSLVITGRAKDIIFVNGQNYYPHDIERICEEVGGIELGKVAACGVQNRALHKDEIIIFVLYKKDLKSFASIAINVMKHVNRKMGLEVAAVIPVKKIPKTTSGKVQRYRLGQMYQDGEFKKVSEELKVMIDNELGTREVALPANEIEKKLLEIWGEALCKKNVGINDNFFEVGGNSILIAQIQSKIEKIYPGKIEVTDIFAYPTISKLADFIKNKINSDVPIKIIKRLRLSEDYFLNGEKSWDYSDIKFRLERETLEGIREISHESGVDLFDILLAIFAYTFAEIAHSDEVVINTLTIDNSAVFSFSRELDKIESIEDLIDFVSQKLKDDDVASFPIRLIDNLNIDKSLHSAAPFFYKNNGNRTISNLISAYDVVLHMDEFEDDLFFTCEYDFRRLKGEKVKEMLVKYNKFLKAFIKKKTLRDFPLPAS